MVTKYSDIITIRGQRAVYTIKEEDKDDWKSFIPNEQFNGVLQKVVASVRNNNIDMHKSFWMEGTYGTGKSHAGAVVMHLLCDPVEEISEWLNDEYSESKYDLLRNDVINLRQNKRLFPVKLYGQQTISHEEDLSLQLQREITQALKATGISLAVKTDFENYVEHINNDPGFWDNLIEQNARLKSVAPTRQKLIADLKDGDTSTLDKVRDALRERKFDIRLSNNNLPRWIFEVQQQLASQGVYDGLFIIWDEFTDVITSAIGMRLLTILQEVDEMLMKPECNSYFFYIMHPKGLESMRPQEREKTKGRYHAMNYNMEPVSAFKIMSHKFLFRNEDARNAHYNISERLFHNNYYLLDVYSVASTDPAETRRDLRSLYPIHPSTANLATYYAREVGSSSRSVFEFIGQNRAITDFLESEEHFKNGDTITADYLWDYVLEVFNGNTAKFGAVTERFNSRRLQVEDITEKTGINYNAVFKGILLLNALNNIANNVTVTPSEENIANLFAGTSIESQLGDILNWLDSNGIIQRQPGGLFSIQFTALPTKEIEEIKKELLNTQFKFTHQVVNFNDTSRREIEKLFLKGIKRPCQFKFYSIDSNEYTLLNKIENGYKECQPYELFFAFLFARNNVELNEVKTIAEKAKDDDRFKYVTFIVFDAVFGDKNYERFIEYQANATVALKHNYADQQQTHIKNASEMLRNWINEMRRSNFTYYLQGMKDSNAAIKMAPTINACVGPTVFSSGPESLVLIQQDNSQTHWKKEKKEKLVNNVLQYNTKPEIVRESGEPNRHIEFLLQDSVDENLEWKPDVDKENHPLYIIYAKIKSTFDHVNKNDQFNLGEKLEYLTRPPYGLFMSAAGMGMVAFAMRRYVKQIFDLNGKPRDQKQLADDIVEMFQSWEKGKTSNKLNFRFETKETRSLCEALVKMFKLNQLPKYSDISSLTDARLAILYAYSDKQGYPLWALKYFPNKDQEKIQTVIDNILKICNESDMRNPDLINNTLNGMQTYKFELGNVLNMENAFKDGFYTFLKQVEMVNLKDEEEEEAMDYLKKHLHSEVGLWSESEVSNQLKNWRLDQEKPKEVEITAGVYPYGSGQVIGVGKFKAGLEVKLAAMPAEGFEFDCWQGINDSSNPLVITAEFTMEFTARFKQKVTKPQPPHKPNSDKKQVALLKVKYINSVEKARHVLEKIIEVGDEGIINIIESEL
jgi:hypothetical protein